MSHQLAYVIVTPYSLYKSRTGGILSRLISRTELDLAAVRMFAPGPELVKQYAETIVSAQDPQDRKIQELLREYVLANLSPDPKTGRHRRILMMVFQGDDAVRKVRSVVGNLSPDRRGGETIRDTYSDLIMDDDGQVRYFEPAVLASPNAEEAEAKLKLWARFSGTDGGVLENVVAYPPGQTGERTLVLIKPDNFKFSTGRPGNVIDFFSRTGLYIVGAKGAHESGAGDGVLWPGPRSVAYEAEGCRCSALKARWRRNSVSKFHRNRKNCSAISSARCTVTTSLKTSCDS